MESVTSFKIAKSNSGIKNFAKNLWAWSYKDFSVDFMQCTLIGYSKNFNQSECI